MISKAYTSSQMTKEENIKRTHLREKRNSLARDVKDNFREVLKGMDNN